MEEKAVRGRSAIWQRYEEATLRQRRPADPTDPGDAADLSIMGYGRDGRNPASLSPPLEFPRRHSLKIPWKSIVS
jgi:hypothetical protein